jgi:hypothetical protein
MLVHLCINLQGGVLFDSLELAMTHTNTIMLFESRSQSRDDCHVFGIPAQKSKPREISEDPDYFLK